MIDLVVNNFFLIVIGSIKSSYLLEMGRGYMARYEVLIAKTRRQEIKIQFGREIR